MKKYFCFLSLLVSQCLQAQDMRYIKQNIATLAGNTFGGRGYVHNSRDKAARFLARNLNELGLLPFDSTGQNDYYQDYYFAVNTFPGVVNFNWGKKELIPGQDFLVDAGSVAYKTEAKGRLKILNLNKIKDSSDWQAQHAKFKKEETYVLKHWDSCAKRLKISKREFVEQLPKAAYVLPQTNKLIWTVATDTISATVLYVADTSIPKGRKFELQIQQKFEPKALSKNVMAFVPGTEIKDSFIVFTAHYDHLGKMGNKAVFAGANDNASGVSFLLALAKYYQEHPQKYSVAFLFFSGEEAGLLGSKYYVAHPVFPLASIKFLTNIDLMGDASQGITIVNGMQQIDEYTRLCDINTQKKYLPEIKKRDNAANSDHYPFTQAAVPAIFIYANGGQGFYHDIYDKPKTLSLNNIPQVFQLLVDFVSQIR